MRDCRCSSLACYGLLLPFLLFRSFLQPIVVVFGLSSQVAQKRQSRSLGELIQEATRAQDLLDLSSRVWLPTDNGLAPHLQSQRIHHEKRQRWSAQLLSKLSSSYPSALRDNVSLESLLRITLGVAIGFKEDRPTKEGKYVKLALTSLYSMIALADDSQSLLANVELFGAIADLIKRAEAMSPFLSLPDVVELRWATKGLMKRLGKEVHQPIPNMNDRVSSLPFDIIPKAFAWSDVVVDSQDITSVLLDEIPFRFDTIVTKTHTAVRERRGTAWLADDGIGALAYSGKLMPPSKVPGVVHRTMRAVESSLREEEDGDLSLLPTNFFDCALCNHYPDATSACKFHTDPEHGTYWDRLNCVVCAGASRPFAFRPIPGVSEWNEWETSIDDDDDREVGVKTGRYDPNVAVSIRVFPGDVVKMWSTCNDAFYHAVYSSEEGEDHTDRRVSLVLKRALERDCGRRGHGLMGEGRRSKARTSANSTGRTKRRRPKRTQ